MAQRKLCHFVEFSQPFGSNVNSEQPEITTVDSEEI